MTDQQQPKRRGRPPTPPGERSDKRPRSVRLGDEHWAKLQRLGTDWLERQIDRARESRAKEPAGALIPPQA